LRHRAWDLEAFFFEQFAETFGKGLRLIAEPEMIHPAGIGERLWESGVMAVVVGCMGDV